MLYLRVDMLGPYMFSCLLFIIMEVELDSLVSNDFIVEMINVKQNPIKCVLTGKLFIIMHFQR